MQHATLVPAAEESLLSMVVDTASVSEATEPQTTESNGNLLYRRPTF